jgi:hypothetical protein
LFLKEALKKGFWGQIDGLQSENYQNQYFERGEVLEWCSF